jgi:hypothetical protein
MPTLAEKLVREFEQLQEAHPYETYGAGVKRQAAQLRERSKRGQRPRRGEWNLRQAFSDDEIRLMLDDHNFAKQMLRAYDPSFSRREPRPSEVNDFVNFVSRNEGPRVFPQVRPGDYFPQMNRQEAARIREDATHRLQENQSLARRAETMLGQTSRLAPLNPLHTTARQLLERNNPEESIRLGREEIAAAGRTDIPREIAPYLERASESPAAFLREYEVNYAPVIENYRREAAQDFLQHDLPRINNQFASRGAFHSSAREAALNKARANKEQRIEHEVARLLTHGREEGMRHFNEQRRTHLTQAEILGRAHQGQQDSRLRAAEALRVNSATGQAALHQQAAALGQLARTEQQQAQNELNVRQLEHREAMERPYTQLSRKAAIAIGAPHPHPQLSPQSMNPPPPSVYGLGSGLIGNMMGLMGQQQDQSQAQHMYARGGSVRRGYAAGDSIARAASQLQQLKQHVQESPEEAEMRQTAQGFKNHRANPMANYLFTLGSHQLANLGEDPMRTFGEGSLHGMRAFKEAQGTNLSAQEKYHNLMDKVNQSKMYQHEFLTKYHSFMQEQEQEAQRYQQQLGETSRHHKATEEETRRVHDLIYGNKLGTEAPSNPNLPQFSSKEEEKSFWKEQQEAKKEFRLQRKVIDKDINNFRHFKSLINKGIGTTGPVIGLVPNALATLLNKPEIAANRFLAQKALNEKVLELSGAMKGAQSDKDMAILQGTVPSMSDTPLTFRKYLDKWEKIATRAEEEKKFVDKKVKQGVPITMAQEEWQEYVNANPLFSEAATGKDTESSQETETSMGGTGEVLIRSPDGEPWRIPQDRVKEALEAGGQLITGNE